MRESKAKKQLRMNECLHILQTQYPNAFCALHYSTPFQLLIATILSAQCTDERVNKVTPVLFDQYSTPLELSIANIEEIENIIHSTGFYKAKSKNIIACSKVLVEKYNGEIPRTMDELHALPGVGRKTANVVLGNAYHINAGITVDTHVTRIMNLLQFVNTKDAVKIERELMNYIPQHEWTVFTHRVIEHGRNTCIARRPKCSVCVLHTLCPSATKSK